MNKGWVARFAGRARASLLHRLGWRAPRDLIDVKDLIRAHDGATHAARADAYFKNAEDNPYYWRKPFNDGETVSDLMRDFSQIVTHLELFQGAKVLDFGAGTCWSSRLFAYMGCSVTAVDISAKALRLGERIISHDPLRDQLDLRFLPFDGDRIDVADASMDRIVCLECFHHVADQRATLKEFHRILKPGGFVAFSEPGPRHSTTLGSQFEMKNYGVIENDIVVEDIWRDARAIGFSNIRFSYATYPRLVDQADFNRLISGKAPARLAKTQVDLDARHHENKRRFFLYKDGGAEKALDSRSPAGLKGALEVTFRVEDGLLKGSILARNTGEALWLTSDQTPLGQVRVGAHHFAADGALLDLNHARFSLGPDPVEPGQSRTIAFELPVPPAGGTLEFDLVAEGVCWFAMVGSSPVKAGPFA
jgi:SAM-dependent methyltransferase